MEWRDFGRFFGYALIGAVVNGVYDGSAGHRQFDYTALIIVSMGLTIIHAIREAKP